MCAWVRIPLLSNFVFKKPTFRSTQYFWESVKSRARRSRFILQEGVIKDRMKQVRYTQGWPSGLRRQTQELLLWDFWYTNVCVGSNITPVKLCVQKGNILIEAVSNPTPVKFCVQKANISVEAVFLRVKSRARRSRFHIKRRCYQRQDEASAIYSRMAERSKAPDSRTSPLRLLVHECVRGFEYHSCQILRSKRQHFNRSSIESHSCQILRSKSQHFGRSSISESQIKSKTKQISH